MTNKILLSASVLSLCVTTAFAVPPPAPPPGFTFFPSQPYPNTTLSSSDAMKANQDKSGFNLFNPTPDDQMRFFSTDLGGPTSVTVDAGHLAVDFSPFSYTYNSYTRFGTDMMTRSYNFGRTGIKLGVLNNFDIEASYAAYTMIKPTDRDAFAEDHPDFRYGWGNTMVRAKYNLFGNDGGSLSAAVMGNVNIPTGTAGFEKRGLYTGGPGIAVDWFSPCGFDCRLDGCMDVCDDDGCWNASFSQSISATHALFNDFYFYGGLESRIREHLSSGGRTESFDFEGGGRERGYDLSAITGFYYMPTPNMNVYVAADFGIHNGDTAGVRGGLNWRLGKLW